MQNKLGLLIGSFESLTNNGFEVKIAGENSTDGTIGLNEKWEFK
jgi:hypothetical protein